MARRPRRRAPRRGAQVPQGDRRHGHEAQRLPWIGGVCSGCVGGAHRAAGRPRVDLLHRVAGAWRVATTTAGAAALPAAAAAAASAAAAAADRSASDLGRGDSRECVEAKNTRILIFLSV